MAGFLFKLEMRDGRLAEPPILSSAVPNWKAGDSIPLGVRTLRVVDVARVWVVLTFDLAAEPLCFEASLSFCCVPLGRAACHPPLSDPDHDRHGPTIPSASA
jgi:hypothetical protein